jgi:hypothetical protein
MIAATASQVRSVTSDATYSILAAVIARRHHCWPPFNLLPSWQAPHHSKPLFHMNPFVLFILPFPIA